MDERKRSFAKSGIIELLRAYLNARLKPAYSCFAQSRHVRRRPAFSTYQRVGTNGTYAGKRRFAVLML